MYISEGMKRNIHKFEELLLDELDDVMEEAIAEDGGEGIVMERFEETKLLLKNLYYLHWLKCGHMHGKEEKGTEE